MVLAPSARRDSQSSMPAQVDCYAFPAGGGEMGALIRAFDWARTPLGPIAGWPQSLRTAVDIVLRSPVPLVMLWGRDGIMIYNDAYSVFAGGRHPQLLGSKVLEGWPEVADLNRRVMEVGLRGETLSFRDEHLVLYRPGRPEDVWVDLDYSPLLDESGKPAGVLAIVVETTERVRAEKALRDSEAQFRTFASAMPNHVWSATPDGKLDWFNQQVHEYTGADRGELEGDRWGEWCIRTTSIARSRPGRRPLRDGTVYEVEFRLRRSDGALPLAPGPRHADPRRGRQGGALDRHQHRHRRSDPRRARPARPRGRSRARPADRQGRRRRGRPRPTASATAARPSISPSTACRRRPPRRSHEDWVRRIHPEDRERDRAAIHRRRQRRRARLQRRIPHHPPERRAGAMDRRQGGDRARCRRPRRAPGRRPHRHHRQKARRAGRARKRGALPSRLGKRARHAVDGRRRRQMPLPQPDAARILGRRARGRRRVSTGTLPCIPTTASAVRVFGQAMRDTRPSPSRPATGARRRIPAAAHGRPAAVRCRSASSSA